MRPRRTWTIDELLTSTGDGEPDVAVGDRTTTPTDGTDALVVTEDGLGDELDAEAPRRKAAGWRRSWELPDRPTSARRRRSSREPRPAVSDPHVEGPGAGPGKVPARKVRKGDPPGRPAVRAGCRCVPACACSPCSSSPASCGRGDRLSSTDNIEASWSTSASRTSSWWAPTCSGVHGLRGALVIVFTVFAVLLALLFNLISDVLGGIRLTVIEPVAPPCHAEGADAD